MPDEGIWCDGGRCHLPPSHQMPSPCVCVLKAFGVMGRCVCVLRASGVMGVGVGGSLV